MNVQERIKELRRLMCEKNIDVYLVPSADNHQSEYVGEYFKSRAFITGFTGSAGTAVITMDKAGLWTDGRYFIQAEKELAGSGIELYKMGNPGILTVDEFLDSVLPENGTLGFDGRVISMSDGKKYKEKFAYKNVRLEDKYDLVDSIWADRPAMSQYPVFILDQKYAGESTSSKLSRVREEMKKAGATAHLLITLDDIAWLLNFRGRDVAYTPVVLSYAIVMMDCVHLFVNEKKLSDEVKVELAKDNVILHPYNDVYDFTAALSSNEVVLLDPARLNYALYNRIPSNIKTVESINPALLFKALKNEVEIENIKKAHIKDAIAHTKFMHWVKTNYNKETITELSASDKLEAFRAEQENFLWPSFAPISAYGPHAAMCHYSSSEETNVVLEGGTLYLTDTGGHYLEGSTDITRTVALGEISDELKRDFTNVLRGNLALSKAKFLHGCSGLNLDILARQYLWSECQDFNHGTGHGVGYLLSIHEPACRFNWKSIEETVRPLEDGMIITDEPGIYIEDSHGIRSENELLVRKDAKNEYGQFMKFEVITFVPFDLDAIEPCLLNEDEKAQLNAYHKQVYDIVAPYLSSEERKWLKEYTREI
jgi:Xaa-Pro aminopeptidase